MADHTIHFENNNMDVLVPTGTSLIEAAFLAGIEMLQPCGGQGRCGRCIVQVKEGKVRRRSSLRLDQEDIEQGYALACQTLIEGDSSIFVPEQESIERRLVTDLIAKKVSVPEGYQAEIHQQLKRIVVDLNPPSMDDQTDDWSRVKNKIKILHGHDRIEIDLDLIRKLGTSIREGEWTITVILDIQSHDKLTKIVDILPGAIETASPLWGIAVDIGTTTVSVWLVDLLSGEVKFQAAEYNQQIKRGEDVISRIIYSSKNGNLEELSQLVINETINPLIEKLCKQAQIKQESIYKASISGNSTMIHLLLGIPASSIRLAPFVTGINAIPPISAHKIGLGVHPKAIVDCLPGVASYVGADITAGVLSSGLYLTDKVTLFMDVGTNGEIVLGNKDWLVTCACSAGPAFEGAGVVDGMRASKGAIEEIWINDKTFEPDYRVIGNVKPKGICGSGLIALIAEMFLVGLADKAGHINLDAKTDRVREGEHGPEYVLAWAAETSDNRDIVITNVDLDNLIRAKASIYAGFSVLAENVGLPLETVEQIFIGGSFGQYINVEKAVQIGLLPDMPWEKFHFLGNTSIKGTYLALLNSQHRKTIDEIASKMTYIELSADNTFYDAFMSALFLPHTDIHKFPSVKEIIKN